MIIKKISIITVTVSYVIGFGFVKTVPNGTTIEIHFIANIKATLLYCPSTPSTWV